MFTYLLTLPPPLTIRPRRLLVRSNRPKETRVCDSREETASPKLQALVCDILPSTTAVFSYAIGSRKLSANEHILVGAQTEVCYKQLRLYHMFIL